MYGFPLNVSNGVLPHSARIVRASIFKPASHYLLTGAGLVRVGVRVCLHSYSHVCERVLVSSCSFVVCLFVFLKKENKCPIAKLVSSHASSVLA